MSLMRQWVVRGGRAGKFLTILVSAIAFAGTLAAQEPVRVAYACTEDDANAFGLTCTMDDPCPVFLELVSADSAVGRLLVAGNLHTKNVTLYGVVLASEDNGLTWTEAHERVRAAALEQIEFFDVQTGWINGESIDPLARNPFFLLTTDGGKTWTQKLVAEDTKYGTVAQFHFDSASHGELVLDASQGRTIRQELYETNTGGDSWELKQVDKAPIRLKNAKAPNQGPLRVRTDAGSGAYIIERGGGRSWDRVATFTIHIADCQ
jgi:photosystem II stability/assembly factor-like uncharacterized protein